MIDIDILNKLNAKDRETRLSNLRTIAENTQFVPSQDRYVNNHIHTTYSFSPYSPTAAVFAARYEGLCTAGIVDHDTIRGAREFLQAAKTINMPVTIGMECRVSMKDTPLEKLRTNNPDQIGISYMTIQSIPHDKLDVTDDFFSPYRKYRGERNIKMVNAINKLLPGINLDYEKDVLFHSEISDGGSVTERHILYGLAISMVKKYGKGGTLIKCLENLGITLSDKQRNMLLDMEYPFYEYDLLNILKSAFISKIYIPADKECPKLAEVVDFAREIDAYLCYAYLGDVAVSVTGDKARQSFEDEYLDLVIDTLIKNGVTAITYMPSRNTKEQLDRLRKLCRDNDLFEISGEDINSPRQSFVIEALKNPVFSNLIESTWKLIEHENQKK